jgi:putative transposase
MKDDNRKDFLSKELEFDMKKILENNSREGMEEILRVVFEYLMKLERDVYLEEEGDFNNKANGYYSRMAKFITNYFKIKVPRDRLGSFRPVFLEHLSNQKLELDNLAFKLYVKGLSQRDIESILKEVFNVRYSASQISLMSKEFQKQRDVWLNKKLESQYYFLYVDALKINVRRDTVEKESFYVVMGLRKDFKREILGVYNTPIESSASWKEHFLDLKKRGLKEVQMIISDELSGIENVSKEVFKGVRHQLCVVHKKRNILRTVRASNKAEIAEDLKILFKAGDARYTKEEAKKEFKLFKKKWIKIYPSIKNKLPDSKFDDYFAFLDFPYQIQSMLYTTNWIERLNKSIRKTTKVRNSMPSVDSAMTLLVASLMDLERDTYMKYPVTSFTAVKDVLNKRFRSN